VSIAQNMPAQALKRPVVPRTTPEPTLAPIEQVLARLEPYRLRENGPDRWRARCPAHGGSNPSALSVGIGDNGAVLLKCWSGCDVDAVVAALGLDVADLFPVKPDGGHGAGLLKRRRLLSALQCLEVIAFDCLVTWVAAHNLAGGHALTLDDLRRLDVAAHRIQALAVEVRA
jgi:hypothetical protein